MLFRRFKSTPLDRILNPRPAEVGKLTDEEPDTFKAGWKPGSKWIIADVEERKRFVWAGPIKLSLQMAAAALLILILALFKPT